MKLYSADDTHKGTIGHGQGIFFGIKSPQFILTPGVPRLIRPPGPDRNGIILQMPIDAFESKTSFHKLLHAYCIHPHVRFESQHNDEEILLLVRAHPITFVPWIVGASVAFIIPIFLNVVLINFMSLKQVLFIDLSWYSVIFSYVFIKVLGWLYNVGIVTDQRVVDIDYSAILHKEVTGTSIEDITDVTARTTGFINSLFGYGDVFVQTAGKEQNIDFLSVPDPSEVTSIINRLMR